MNLVPIVLNRRCIARPTTIRLNIKIIMLLYMVTIRKKVCQLGFRHDSARVRRDSRMRLRRISIDIVCIILYDATLADVNNAQVLYYARKTFLLLHLCSRNNHVTGFRLYLPWLNSHLSISIRIVADLAVARIQYNN